MSEEILNQLAADMNKLLTEPVGSRSVKITDLTPRDGQQCKLATRVTTDDLLPLCASLDNCGFYAVEVWGGATFDVCMRYLNEDPWDRLRRIKSVMPKTKLQMLLRGQHILAYRPYTAKIVWKFVERAIANGMNVFRIFEATNDFRNIESATKAVKELGGEAHVDDRSQRNGLRASSVAIETGANCRQRVRHLEGAWIAIVDILRHRPVDD